jgi:hypothetical protein
MILRFQIHVIGACFLWLVLMGNSALAQQDFNNFKTLLSAGLIPADFSSKTYEKIREDLKNHRTDLKGKAEKVFLEGIHYSIDDLLHSGMVIYGDEISAYVSAVAGHLLENDAALQGQLRFYIIKSNVTNAFSTDQGIIFVTTGLISQLTNEAQLAYVLAHEISHYTEKHVVETFDWSVKNGRKDNTIQRLSQYAKEKEFEADKLGMQLYKSAGYAKSEVMSTFDVLMFSYLPFDEAEFPKTYYNSEHIFIPEIMFPAEKFPVKAVEDADDSRSSHPNIKRRKDAAAEHISSMPDWGDESYFLGEERFKYIRNLSRFESIRTDIMDASFADALYTIFLLEKEFPASMYLQRMKAKAWLGLAQFRQQNLVNRHLQKNSDYEGEVATVHFFLKKLDKLAMSTVAMREIEDIRKAHPDDKEIKAIWDRMVQTLTITDKFELTAFSTKTYQQAEEEFTKLHSDTLAKAKVEPESEKLTKYEKIKKKKEVGNPENFNAEKFYLYALGDLIQSPDFLAAYKQYKDAGEEENRQLEARKALSSSERSKENKLKQENALRISTTDLIYVEPTVYSYKRDGEISKVKSERLASDFSAAIETNSRDLEMRVNTISSANLKAIGTPGFNERAILLSCLMQLREAEKTAAFPVDYELLQEIQTNYGTNKILFSMLEHSYSLDISFSTAFISVVFYPIGLVVFPIEILTGNHTELNVIVMDIDKGKIEGDTHFYYKEPLTRLSLEAHVYDILLQVKSNPL